MVTETGRTEPGGRPVVLLADQPTRANRHGRKSRQQRDGCDELPRSSGGGFGIRGRQQSDPREQRRTGCVGRGSRSRGGGESVAGVFSAEALHTATIGEATAASSEASAANVSVVGSGGFFVFAGGLIT